MGLRIQHNIVAMNAQRQLSISDANMSKSLERLSSGYRINRAADDAAGLAISQSMRADIASYQVASRNASEASSLLQVAEGATDQISNMLTRLKELATQAASANVGTNYDKLEEEKDALVAEIDRIAQSAEYAGTALIDGTFGTYSETWATNDSEKALEDVNGKTYLFTDDSNNTTTVTFSFSSSPAAIDAGAYTLATMGATLASGVSMTKTGGETYVGSVVDDTITFDTIGLTLTGAATFTTTMIASDSITVADAGFTSMAVSSDTPTDGTWTITDAANSVTISDGTNSQTVTSVDASVQTLDFDQIGITLKLGTDYATGDLNALEFDVASSGSSTFQIGASNEATSRIEIGLESSRSEDLGIDSIDLTTQSGARSAMSTIDDAISTLSNVRGNIGAYMNRLGYAAANLATTIENVQASESVIRDVDMASEMSNFTKNQILMQAGTSMLAQANMSPQLVLTLFQ